MAERAKGLVAVARRLGAASLVGLCAACGTVSDPAGFSVVAQDKYDFESCPVIVAARNGHITRERQLADLVAKTESGPGGILVSYAAYRSELTQTRALLAAANRAAQKNNCDLTKK
jgi:hypothetical protein